MKFYIVLHTNKMEEITIYKFQLDTIIEALRITSNIHDSSKGVTCHDRQVRQALKYAENAAKGQKDIKISYATGLKYE